MVSKRTTQRSQTSIVEQLNSVDRNFETRSTAAKAGVLLRDAFEIGRGMIDLLLRIDSNKSMPPDLTITDEEQSKGLSELVAARYITKAVGGGYVTMTVGTKVAEAIRASIIIGQNTLLEKAIMKVVEVVYAPLEGFAGFRPEGTELKRFLIDNFAAGPQEVVSTQVLSHLYSIACDGYVGIEKELEIIKIMIDTQSGVPKIEDLKR
jgi:hypothetical protein